MLGKCGFIALLLLSTAWTLFPERGHAAISSSSVQVPSQSSNATSTQSNASTQNDAAAQIAEATAIHGPVQPVPFSHKQHAGTLKMSCGFCHATSRSGDTVLIPQAAFCMQCHRTIDTTNPDIQRLAADAKSNATIPWVRIYELPSFVTFSHRTHLLHGVTCEECHGAVAERVQLYKEADISMATCVNCHQAKKASTGCNTCHMLDQ